MRFQELNWRVAGHGLDRISRTRLHGHCVTVRPTTVDQEEIWVIDVDDERCCGQYVKRVDAMCEAAVRAAIQMGEARIRRPSRRAN